MKSVRSLGGGRIARLKSATRAMLPMLALLMTACRIGAGEVAPPKSDPNLNPNPVNGSKKDSPRLPDPFEARLDGSEDDKDAAGESVALPPLPSEKHAEPPQQNRTPDPSPAKTEKTGPKSEPPPVSASTPKLLDPFNDTQPTAPETEPDEMALSVESPPLKSGGEALFALSGPGDFLREADGDYVIGDDLGRQLAHGRVPLGAIPIEPGGIKHFKIAPPIELMLPAEKYKSRASGLKLHADFTFSSPGKPPVKLGADLLVADAGTAAPGFADPRVTALNRWIALTANPPAGGAWEKLNALGIFGGMQIRTNAARRESLRKGNAPYYVENVTRQMLSRYHTERGLWQKTIAEMASNHNGGNSLARDPSLCSPSFADAFSGEITKIGEAYAGESPLFFSLASEPSMTRLNAAADFDFSPAALDEFRRWLERDAYGTLAALNESWGTHFENWRQVVPMTTDDARLRLQDGVGNFAPWADFREFQDYTFAKTLREGADLLRTKVSGAKVGITGAMGPFAYGGWDWSRLAADLDAVEAYDIGCARALWRDLAPGKPALAALELPSDGNASAEPELSRTLWQFALEGGPRGALFWETPAVASPATGGANAGSALFDASGEPTPLAKALAPTLRNLNGETGRLLAQSRRDNDGVALLYSPASIRIYWLLESDKLHGAEWLQTWGLDFHAERRESLQLRLRESWCKLLDDCGVGWRFMSSRELERGDIQRTDLGIKTLILPRAIALSDREVEAIKQFAANGGRVIADAVCARFDDHGRLRARPALDDLFGVNTASEPFFAQAVRPLHRITPLPVNGPGENSAALAKWDAEFCGNLPPAFSDEPKWLDTERSGKRRGAEYRMSPVFASRNGALYLNLDLTDYLRWRLHPELPRARTARKALLDLAFKPALDASPVDWSKTKLPHGTQVIRLSMGSGAKSAYLLALRRNPQARLFELGADGDGNWAFEKPEPFEVHFKSPVWLRRVVTNEAGAAAQGETFQTTRSIAGALDPVKPWIVAFQTSEPGKLNLSAESSVSKLQRFEIAVQPPADDPHPAFYFVRVTGPDQTERPHYGGMVASKDGALSHVISFAMNDPAGTWTVQVRDAMSGASAEIRIDVKE